MDSVGSWQEAIMAAGSTVLSRIALFLPNLFGALFIFALGWVIAGLVQSLVARIVRLVQLHHLVEGTAVETFMKKAELKGKVEEILGGISKWIVIFIFFIAAVNVLGLTTVSLVLQGILGYIPKVISASLILVAGVLLAGVVESVVKGAAGTIAVSTSRLLGKIASWVVMIFATLAAVSELGIAAQVINTLIIGVVATLSLGTGLAIGLGSKDLVRDILAEWYGSFKKDLKRK